MDKKFTTRDLTLIAVGAALIALCSWISVPMTIPFTMQTFAVCLVSALFGARRGMWTVACYLLLGAVGAPVFAGFTGGVGILLGTTGGYLVGFMAMALVYWLMTALAGEGRWARVAALVAALAMCYAFGTAWFVIVYTRQSGTIGVLTALSWCVFPFVLPDLIKMALALVLTGRVKRRIR